MFEIFILGCGGTQPLPRRHLSSVLVRYDGQSFLFDCGEGTQVALKRHNLGWKKISHIFVSHIHADHVTGIPGLMMLSSQVDRKEPLHIVGPKGLDTFVNGVRESLNLYVNYPFKLSSIESEKNLPELYENAQIKISCFPLIHSQVCYGFLIEEKPKPGIFSPEAARACRVPMGPLWSRLQSGEPVQNEAGETIQPSEVLGPSRPGKRLAFMTDTLYAEHFYQFVQGVDLLVCEGMFENALAETAHEKKHMTAVEAALIAREAKVKQLAITHFSPRYADKELKKLFMEAKEYFPETILCRDGLHLTL